MSKLPRISRMLDEVFAPSIDTEPPRRTRFVTLDRDGNPEAVVNKTAQGNFVYRAGDPRCGDSVPASVRVLEQVFDAGRWVETRGAGR